MRVGIVLLASSAFLLAGCGGSGSDGCVTTANVSPNPAYAGDYVATYTPSGDAIGGSLDFVLRVATNGTVTGQVHNPSINPEVDADVTGTVRATNDSCGTGLTYIELGYAFSGGESQGLDAKRRSGSTIDATFPIEGTVDGSVRQIGALKIEPLATTN